MYNPTTILIQSFTHLLERGYQRNYGGQKPEYGNIISWSACMALENIANSDALYHNVEHTIFVSLVGQEILRGQHIRDGGVSCEDWLHSMISLLCHDIGYVKGINRRDLPDENRYSTGVGDEMIGLHPGASDASLAPYHVDRGKQFIEDRFRGHAILDIEVIKRNIELTRFPVPSDHDHKDPSSYPGLIRAADLIGQLSDPRYLNKVGALYYEFEEMGFNTKLGFHNPSDLRRNYPAFFWKVIHPYIRTAVRYLTTTQEGKQILANLYANVFVVENEQPDMTAGFSQGPRETP